MNRLADLLRAQGASYAPRDSILAHITPAEARLLKKRGGSGEIDPVTGLPHFDQGDNDDSSGDSYGDGGSSMGSADEGATSTGSGTAAGSLGFSDDPTSYMSEVSPDVSPTSAFAQEAISNWAENPDAWAGEFGDYMSGQPSGMLSDLGAWMSREGLWSMPGAQQVGLLDDVNVSGILGNIAGIAAGPFAGLATHALSSYLGGLMQGNPNAGRDAAYGATRGMVGNTLGSIASAISPAAGPIGSQLGLAAFDQLAQGPSSLNTSAPSRSETMDSDTMASMGEPGAGRSDTAAAAMTLASLFPREYARSREQVLQDFANQRPIRMAGALGGGI